MVVLEETTIPASLRLVSSAFTNLVKVRVQWDEDGDDRVLWFIDHLPERVREQLLIVQEHEGELALRWKLGWAPSGYRQGDEVDVGGDLWSIGSSLGTMGTAEEPPE